MISINIRLTQRREIRGTDNRYKVCGLAFFDCAECDRSGPDQGADQKRERNCKRPGFEDIGQETPGRTYRIDNTGRDERDRVIFCPASVADPSLQRQIFRVLDMERLSALGRATHRPLLHQPLRIKTFFLATLAARDRFNDELSAAELEVNRPR